MSDGDAASSREIFNITMAQVTAIIEPHSVPNDIRWGRLAEFGDVYLYSSADSINSE